MAKSNAKSSGGGKKGGDTEVVIENRKARFDYAILDTLETGMILWGSEVKSIRKGEVSLAEGFVRAEGGMVRGAPVGGSKVAKGESGAKAAPSRRVNRPGLYLHQVNIGEYGPAGPTGSSGQHAATRVRELLAHKREIVKLAKQVQVKGLTLIPLKIYFKNGKAKLLIGLAQGKTRSDKRQSIAKRDSDRDIQRAMSKRV